MRETCPRCWLPVERVKSMAGIWSDMDPTPIPPRKRKKAERRFVIIEGILMDTSHHLDQPEYVPHERSCPG